MLFSTIAQPLIFLWMAVCGGIIALWYALLAFARRLTEAGFWLSLLWDLVFALGCAVILIAGLVLADYGRVRLYALLGVAFGAGLTAFALISPLKRLLEQLWRVLQGFMTKLAKYRLTKVLFR